VAQQDPEDFLSESNIPEGEVSVSGGGSGPRLIQILAAVYSNPHTRNRLDPFRRLDTTPQRLTQTDRHTTCKVSRSVRC